MTKMRLFVLIGICVLNLALVFSGPAVEAAEYTFTCIRDVTSWTLAMEPPMINNQGTVYFRAQQNPAADMLLYVKPYYSSLRTYLWYHGTTPLFVYEPVMNDRSQMAFRWGAATGIDMARLPGAPTQMVLSSQLGTVSTLRGVNDSGHIVFLGRDNLKDGIYKCTAPQAIQLVVEEGTLYTDFNWFEINDSGEIAYQADLAAGGAQVRTTAGLVAQTSPTGFVQVVWASINNSGTVAFWASTYTVYVTTGIYTGTAGDSCTAYVTDIDDGILPAMEYPPDINDQGQVAYVGGYPDPATATIFIGPDPVADKVIAIGDALDGSTVDGLTVRQINGHFFNDYGQVAFSATLADGRHGYYRADPEGLVLPGACPACPAVYEILLDETSGAP